MIAKMFKCKYCGDEVYEEYWQGQVMIREVRFLESKNLTTEPHNCSLRFTNLKEVAP